MQPHHQRLVRSLPKIDEVTATPTARALEAHLPRSIVVDLARQAVAEVRAAIIADTCDEVSLAQVEAALKRRAALLERPSLRRVINATGVVIHTNLGRSVLAPEAAQAVMEVARGYSTLEYDTEAMERGSRHAHCERLLTLITGAEAAIAVNNNAAAVMMVLSAFASGGEGVVSRGELVEIGGSFRIPDIMEQSGAHMVEVGTTNKTRRGDYERAITEHTAVLLKVHPSNYRMLGFTAAVELEELRALADAENARRAQKEDGVKNGEQAWSNNQDRNARPGRTGFAQGDPVIVFEDQGSGAIVGLPCFGEGGESTVAESLRQGADLVSFSGDKLLGGPQAGIIAGRADLIAQLKSHPLARVLRLDKMTLAALEATLRLCLDADAARSKIPTLRMLSEDPLVVRRRADALKERLERALPEDCAQLEVVSEIARAGGGALPLRDFESFAVRVSFLKGDAQSCERFLTQQRDIPVICRIKKEAVLADVRTLIDQAELDEVAQAFAAYFTTLEANEAHAYVTEEA